MSAGTTFFDRAAFGVFLVLTASLAIQKPSIVTVAGKELAATDLIFPIAFVAVFISLLSRQRKLAWKPVYWFIAAYVAAFAIALSFAENRSQGLIKTAATAYLVFIAIIAVELVDSWKRLRFTALTFLFASFIPLFVGLATIVIFYLSPGSSVLPLVTYHYGAVPVGNYPRLSSTFVSASMFCNYLNVVLMFLLIARAKKWIDGRLAVFALAATVICVIFTISSGIGAVCLAIGLWYWYRSSRNIRGRLVLEASISACLLFFATGFIALQKHATAPYSLPVPLVGSEVYPSPRLLVWTESFNNFLENFLVGGGPGTPSAAVMFQNSEGGYSLLTDAHNSFLSIATQTGVIGLIALVALTGYLLTIGFTKRDPVNFGLAAAFLTAVVVQGLLGSFEDARHLWFLIGLVVAASRLGDQKLTGELGGSA